MSHWFPQMMYCAENNPSVYHRLTQTKRPVVATNGTRRQMPRQSINLPANAMIARVNTTPEIHRLVNNDPAVK